MRLVQFETKDGLRLNGAVEDVGSETTIIHIHGKSGNFYENKFVKIMLEAYPSAGFNFLTFNNRGHSTYVEAMRKGEIVYVGSAVEKFSESLLDLEAAEQFARTLGPRVVLQGHSFGCEKIMFYSQHVNPNLELVLLSPCDGYRLQNVYIAPETVDQQVERLRRSYRLQGLEWLPQEDYGIRVPGKTYHVPIVAESLVDLLTGPAFQLLAVDKPWAGPLLSARSFVYLGGRDPLQVGGVEPMVTALRSRFQDARITTFPEGEHHLAPIQRQVVASITSWLRESPSADHSS